MSLVDNRLAQVSDTYVAGQEIQLRPSDVHSFGLDVRELSRDLYEQANKKYF